MPATLPVLAAAGGLVCGQALDDAVPGQHASIDGEVATDHESTHGSILLGQRVRLVRIVRLVLATVDKHETDVPFGVPITLIHGVQPAPSSAETCRKPQLAD